MYAGNPRDDFAGASPRIEELAVPDPRLAKWAVRGQLHDACGGPLRLPHFAVVHAETSSEHGIEGFRALLCRFIDHAVGRTYECRLPQPTRPVIDRCCCDQLSRFEFEEPRRIQANAVVGVVCREWLVAFRFPGRCNAGMPSPFFAEVDALTQNGLALVIIEPIDFVFIVQRLAAVQVVEMSVV